MRNVMQNLVLGSLRQLRHGRLQATLPDGSEHDFGDDSPSMTELRARIQIKRPDFFRRCFFYGDVGFGEAFVEGDWDSDDPAAVIRWFLANVENSPSISGSKRQSAVLNLLRGFNRLYHRARPNSLRGSGKNIREHYDLSNEFFSLWLDPSMTYSSANFERPELSLEAAQEAKYRRLLERLQVAPGHRILEIGCGWGGFAVYAAKHFGADVTGLTISPRQHEYAAARVRREGLEGKVRILLDDYRLHRHSEADGRYDRIVSIEMIEAVGDEYLDAYFGVIDRLLKPEGLVGIQGILCPDARYEEMRDGVDWIQKHIFPGSLLPSLGRIGEALRATGDLGLYDLKDLGLDYARTLGEWRANFNRRRAEILALGFDERFCRKWNYYLEYCRAAFEMKGITVAQMIFARPNCAELRDARYRR